MGFTKLDSGIVQSSIMTEDSDTFKAWIVFLASCGSDGIARVSPVYVKSICNFTIERTLEIIKKLESPDPLSRSINNEGRRIERVDGGYRIINYHKYREYTYSDNPEAIRKREYRKMGHKRDMSGQLQDISASASTSTSDSVSSEEDSKEKQKTWRDSFDVYLAGCTDTYEHLLNNVPWIVEQERFHPNVDIRLSLEKAYKTFWGTEAGWKHKKRKRSKDIDWLSTLTSAISLNKVWKPKDNNRQSDFDRNWNAAMEQMNNEST